MTKMNDDDLGKDNKEEKNSLTISSNFSQQNRIFPPSSYHQTVMSNKLIHLLPRLNFPVKTRILTSVFFPCSIYLSCVLFLNLTIDFLLTNS